MFGVHTEKQAVGDVIVTLVQTQNKACVEGNVCLKTLVWLLTVGSSIADYIRFKRHLTSLEVCSGLVSCACQEIGPFLEFATSSACVVFHDHDEWTVFIL